MIEKPNMYKIIFSGKDVSRDVLQIMKRCFANSNCKYDFENHDQEFSFGPYTADVIKTKMLEITSLCKGNKYSLSLERKGDHYFVKES